ncbi:MAG: hypothetical protein EBT93_17575 [Alphaproteobacteria bacterium]|nr:hypothetical protein [Alphaproteobacteria bacterium]
MMMAVHLLKPTLSFKNNAAAIVTVSGRIWMIAVTFGNGRCFKAKRNDIVAITSASPRSSISFQLARE